MGSIPHYSLYVKLLGDQGQDKANIFSSKHTFFAIACVSNVLSHSLHVDFFFIVVLPLMEKEIRFFHYFYLSYNCGIS